MTITFLASGSKANSAVIEYSSNRLLLDAGLSLSDTMDRMRRAGLNGNCSYCGVLLTHGHPDHAKYAKDISRTMKIPVWPPDIKEGDNLSLSSGAGWFGTCRVHSFGQLHDHDGCIAYGFELDGRRMAYATDLGSISDGFAAFASECELIAIEANHSLAMLRASDYAEPLKKRVEASHLSNRQVAAFLAERPFPKLHTVVLLHLSENNNLPSLARAEIESVLPGKPTRVLVASQDEPLGPLEV